MTPNVLQVTREELLQRKERLLQSLGMTREQLAERAESYSLTGQEWDVLTQVEDVEFLLNER